MKGKNIVMIGQQGWDLGLGSNAHNLAAEFSLAHKVVYINPPLDVKTLFRGWRDPKIRYRLKVLLGLRKGSMKVARNLWVYTPAALCLSVNWIRSARLFRFFTRLNNRLFAGRIRQITAQAGFDDYLLFNDSLIYLGLDLKEMLQPEKYVYYIRDNMVGTGYFRHHGPAAEGELMRKADVVVANSEFLADYAAAHNPQSYYVGQGCDLRLFDAASAPAEPEDLAAVPHPRVGYVGYLTSDRLDLGLLLRLAQAKPEWNFVFVGPEDSPFHSSALHQLPNVHFLGSKPGGALPAYLQHFDVCLNPQLVNEITVGNYPRKIDEYLAMGKPVVATWTRTMQMFQQQVYLASSLAGYLELIEKALAEDSPERRQSRIAFARSHTWAASVALIGQALMQAQTAGSRQSPRQTRKAETSKPITLSPQNYATANTSLLDQIAFIHKQEL